MKRIIIFIFILIASCSTPEKNSIDYKELILTENLASKLISLSINCVDKKYPYKIGYRFIDESWIKPHYEITPSFYGCWDWHSAVHGHWAMVKVLKEFPEIDEKEIIIKKLTDNLNEENLRLEYEFFQNDFAKGFERTYGWAWLMMLYYELATWDYPKAKLWSNNLKPLVDLLSERTILFLDKLSTPLRPGTHANTAFSFSLMVEYAKNMGDNKLLNKIKEYSLTNFKPDVNCPVNYEPSGTDFLSPCLAEAGLMSKILSREEFSNWFYKFIPSFDKDDFGTIISPPKVLDPEDPGIGHLIGLMFHRAWTLKFISNNLTNPEDKKFLLNISKEHSHNGFEIMFDSGYGGEHWLATFAIYNFTR
tara:strand:- start:3304 stop:4392 length:1089 start_codon:yes stop_codon:yes gene_type:complete